MATEDLVNKINEMINALPTKNKEEIERMASAIDENMNMDKHSIQDIIQFTKGILVSLSLSIYLVSYSTNKQQEQGY